VTEASVLSNLGSWVEVTERALIVSHLLMLVIHRAAHLED